MSDRNRAPTDYSIEVTTNGNFPGAPPVFELESEPEEGIDTKVCLYHLVFSLRSPVCSSLWVRHKAQQFSPRARQSLPGGTVTWMYRQRTTPPANWRWSRRIGQLASAHNPPLPAHTLFISQREWKPGTVGTDKPRLLMAGPWFSSATLSLRAVAATPPSV